MLKLKLSRFANLSIALDPLPFISSFSPALDHLLSLQKSVSRKTKDLEGEVREAERSCEGRLREIDGGFEVGRFASPDQRFSLLISIPTIDHRKLFYSFGDQNHRGWPDSC